MKEAMVIMMDLADYLQIEVDKTSVRAVAKHIDIAKTTVQNIVKRNLKTMPDMPTLQKIADAYGITVPTVVEMAGAMLGDTEKYTQIARELELHPWIAEEWTRLSSMTKDEFKEAVDYMEWRKRHPLPLPNGDQSNP